jgi:hypothetical protein
MKRILTIVGSLAMASFAAGCGDTNIFGDGGADSGENPDLAMVTLFRLPQGVYKVSGPVTIGNDQCMVDPNNATNPTAGQIWALQNDGTGLIKLNNPSDPDHPDMVQQYGAEVGNPAQPALGASCPGGAANPAQCSTEPNAVAFNNNMGTLVRDNGVTTEGGVCMLHRHIVNQVNLTADGKFTAAYTRTDTNHQGCTTITTDCTTTWTWNFEFVKDFGK